MNKHAWWTWCIRNSIVTICWTALAIFFGKWWIALFMILFLTGLETNSTTKHYRQCDLCGKYGPNGKDESDAIEKAKKAGWVHCGDDKDYCPECYTKMLNGGK